MINSHKTPSLLGHSIVQLFIIALFLFTLSCKKGTKEPVYSNDIISLVFNLGAVSEYDRGNKVVNVKIADYFDKTKLVAIFQLSPGATAKVKGQVQESSTTPNDFTSPVVYTIVSQDGKTADWTIKIESNNSLIGLGNVVQEEKRLIRNYEWYQSQDTSGRYSLANSGPACLAMALNYVNRTIFADMTTVTVRDEATAVAQQSLYGRLFGSVAANNSAFTTIDMVDYLRYKNAGWGVNWRLIRVSATQQYSEITECIDKGYLVIVLVDMSHIPYNTLTNQHTNRWYEKTPYIAGHYFVIKGYKKVDGNLWYEVYDPLSQGSKYPSGGQLKAWNRYYYAENVRRGSVNGQDGWGYAFVVHSKLNSPFPEMLRNELSPAEVAPLMVKMPSRLWGIGY